MLKAEHYTPALRHFREVAEHWPERVESYEGLKKAYRAMGLVDEARREAVIAEALTSLKKDSGDVESRLRLIRALVAKHMYATALLHVETALKQASNHQEVLRMAGIVLRATTAWSTAS